MNSSEPLVPLSSHEEKLTAYLDGSLPAEDAAAFERAHPEAVALKSRHDDMAAALRAHSVTPALRNGEFFNHQIIRQIQPPAPARESRSVFPLWRLLFATACCLLAALGVYKIVVPGPSSQQPQPQLAATDAVPQYMVKVTSVRPGDHLLKAEIKNAEGLAVVWVDGMEKLPTNYVLQ